MGHSRGQLSAALPVVGPDQRLRPEENNFHDGSNKYSNQ